MINFKKLIRIGGYLIAIILFISSCKNESLPTGTIYGKVFYKGTTVPVPGVIVDVNGYKDSTSEIGYFSINNIPIGEYVLNAKKYGFDLTQAEVLISNEAIKQNIELTSELFTSSVSGIIKGDQTGNPQSDIRVRMLNPDGTESSLQMVSGSDGKYNIANIPQGERTFIFISGELEINRCQINLQSWDYVLDILVPEPNIPFRFTDERDGNTYLSMLIGNQTWMIENLRYLPAVHSPRQESAENPMYYVYRYWGNNVEEAIDSVYYNQFGVAYNYSAAVKACPSGWHLPSDNEWNELQIYLGMSIFESEIHGYQNSGNVGFKLKSKTGWPDGDNGNNSSYMNIIPAGGKIEKGSFYLPIVSSHWTSTEFDSQKAWVRAIHPDRDAVNRIHHWKTHGHFIRCVKNK